MKKNIRRTWIAVTLLAFLGVTALLLAPTTKLGAFMEFAGDISGPPEADDTALGGPMVTSPSELPEEALTLASCKGAPGKCENQGAGCTAAGGGAGQCDDDNDTVGCYCKAI